MPANKNQHFVPRCYLRSFSWGGNGKAINLYNIALRMTVLGAPVKNQCARDYLYCKDDPRLEKALKLMEDGYASSIRALDKSADQVSEFVGPQLRSFMMLQYFRTEAAMRRVETAFTGSTATMTRATGQAMPPVAGGAREMMLESLGVFARSASCINDLNFCILDNATPTDFVTSDDPVCMTSKFHADRQLNAFGLESTGVLLFLPLSPRLLFLCYDANAYSLEGSRQRLRMHSVRDVLACNDLQYLNARENIYFAPSTDSDRVACEAANASSRRPSARMRITTYAKLPPAERGIERYRRLASDERVDDQVLVTMSPVHVFPASWPSMLKYRDRLAYLFNGSLGGYMRPKAHHTDTT